MGLTRDQLNEEARQNLEASIYRHEDGPTPFYLNCPLDYIEDVARGLTEVDIILFLWGYCVIKVGGREWCLDGDLPLWRKARDCARQLQKQGLLDDSVFQGGFAYQRR